MDYELLDSGSGEKLERFGRVILARLCRAALWPQQLKKEEWLKASARFNRDLGNSWQGRRPTDWKVDLEGVTFQLTAKDFGHVGLFPEHANLWRYAREKITLAKRPISVLNLFAYTGGMSLVAAKAGAHVCHVDAAQGIVDLARQNAKLSGLQEAPIRWIVEDVFKFLKREIKRGKKYEGIVLDPPSFGRGTQGEVFKIEEELVALLQDCKALLSDDPLFFILSCHTPGVTPQVMENILKGILGKKAVYESGELVIPSKTSYPLPLGGFARASWNG